MVQMIFVNLPVKNLAASTEFYTGLGFSKNSQFSDENASSIVISDSIVFMLLVEPFFKTFIKKDIADTNTAVSAIIALSRDSREAVDELADKALASGATPANDVQDLGFMYGRSFNDPNGHQIEVMWMDPAAVQG